MNDDDATTELGFLRDLGLDGEVSFAASDRGSHDGDYGTADADAVTPAAVVYAASTADVSAVLAGATERGIPVTPYGGGTGFEGGATPLPDGISLDTTRLDAVIDVRPDDLQVDVGAGVVGDDLNDHLASYGLFLPTVPSSGESATIGGMIATDASGMRTVKYGEVSDWVLAVEAVLPDGTVVELGSTTAKTSSGYNLKDLVVGSEGTLAVVTRATLELAGRPEQVRGARAVFPTLGDATAAISDAVAAGVDAAAMELLDADTARVANDYAATGLPDAPLVFCEFHANHAIEAEIDYCRSIFESHGCERFEVAGTGEMDELWEARHDLAFALDTYDPERGLGQPGDVTVPIGEYRTIVEYVKELAAEYDLFVPCFGHAGDGNVHYTTLVDRDDPDEVARAEELYGRVVDRAIELGGTATGEHGIGTGKRKYMAAEHGAAVEPMRAIKEAIDPEGIMNPEKVIPARD
ncbi:FAD-binding oxidoreductase [Haloparvum sp. PAK95]|uniref:FAD-binding oxidoreductase n=1 Tax=Haloparvum sp. PAK95 TaxID=3418962 RepID=UPI003D2ED219